jgi:hypothetical protein
MKELVYKANFESRRGKKVERIETCFHSKQSLPAYMDKSLLAAFLNPILWPRYLSAVKRVESDVKISYIGQIKPQQLESALFEFVTLIDWEGYDPTGVRIENQKIKLKDVLRYVNKRLQIDDELHIDEGQGYKKLCDNKIAAYYCDLLRTYFGLNYFPSHIEIEVNGNPVAPQEYVDKLLDKIITESLLEKVKEDIVMLKGLPNKEKIKYLQLFRTFLILSDLYRHHAGLMRIAKKCQGFIDSPEVQNPIKVIKRELKVRRRRPSAATLREKTRYIA